METSLQRIEDLYEEKTVLLQELLDCVTLEREQIIAQNTENLWALMEKKQAVLKNIEGAGERIRSEMEKSWPGGKIPSERGKILAPLTRKMRHLQEEIRTRVSENVSFIREALVFFDELIALLVSVGRPEPGYRQNKKGQSDLTSLILHKEV